MHRTSTRLLSALTISALASWSAIASADDATIHTQTEDGTVAPTTQAPVSTTAGDGYAMTTSGESEVVTYDSIRPNRPMLIAGLVIFGGTYAATAIAAAQSDRDADDKLFIPVAGPWINLGDRGCSAMRCEDETRNKALIIGSGIAQGVGAVLAVTSLFVPERVPQAKIEVGSATVQIAPQVSPTGYGFFAAGSF